MAAPTSAMLSTVLSFIYSQVKKRNLGGLKESPSIEGNSLVLVNRALAMIKLTSSTRKTL